jgi:O-antigen/teichoic acid export membrane protein
LTSQATEPPAGGRVRPALLEVVGRLAAVNGLVMLLAFVTGPILARALGPEGRGNLAAILLPVTLAPVVFGLGLGTYVTRQVARGRPAPLLLGSVGPLVLGLGVVAALLGPSIAALFAGGRDVVHTYVLVGFLLMPLSLLILLLQDVAIGLERWSIVVMARVVSTVASTVAVVVLYVMGALTVASAAIVMLTAGLLSALPTLALIPDLRRPRFRRDVARDSVPFGLKAWVGGLGSVANVRLDQVLMTRLVEPRELGLYVVAFTVSNFFINPVVGALSSGMMPRFASGDPALIARVLRTTVAGVALVSALIAIGAPLIIRVVFGADFSDALPMAWLLLVATVPLAGVTVLSTALTSSGHPGFSAASELVTLLVTVPLLLLTLSAHGAIAAALISIAAYCAGFAWLLVGARRHLRIGWRELLVIRREDVSRVTETFRTRAAALWRRGAERLRRSS